MIRKFLQSALCICLSTMLVAQQPAAKPNTVRLPKDTSIQLKLDQDVSSATVHKGDLIRYVVAEDVVAEGATVIPAGTAVTRKVTSAKPSKPNEPCGDENNGSFELSDSMFFSVNGPQIKLTTESPQVRAQDAMSPGDKVLFAILAPPQIAFWIASAAVIGPFALIADIHDHLHSPPPPAPCPAKTHEMEWKASEANVETYYMVHNYTVRANLPSANSEPEAAKDDQ